MTSSPFPTIARRSFQLKGPADRVVTVLIGAPESDPAHAGGYRCPFQVVGLSDDDIQYARGVDSFQALNLAVAGARRALKTTAHVLAAFHDDFSLTHGGDHWELGFPFWVSVNDIEQLQRFERFMDNGFWKRDDEPHE